MALLLLGDLACFALFAFIGLRSHGEPYTAGNFLRAATPFAVAWVFCATLAGLYRAKPLRPAARTVLAAWLPAWLAGLLVRSIAFDRPLKPGFAVVALLFIGACLVAWRAVAQRLPRRSRSPATVASGPRRGA